MRDKLNIALRKKLITLHFEKKAIHLGSSLSCIDILSFLLIDSNVPFKDVLLSKGHAASALYICLNQLGHISDEELETYYQNNTQLTAHPIHNTGLVRFSSGSLGHGLSLACGLAKARKLKNNPNRVYCVISDGELNEGSTFEAINFAIQHQLNNLTVIIDNNKFQGLGATATILGDLSTTFSSRRNLCYQEINGHSYSDLKKIIEPQEHPTVINANTTKGKGISFAENDNNWHYNQLTQKEYNLAISEL